MKIMLTKDESEKFFYNALCNGLGYLSGYGLELTYNKQDYVKARKNAVSEFDSPCYEEVLMQILRNGGTLSLVDHESGEETKHVTLADIHTNVSNTPAKWLLQMIDECDDAVTADCILQSTFYGDILFG